MKKSLLGAGVHMFNLIENEKGKLILWMNQTLEHNVGDFLKFLVDVLAGGISSLTNHLKIK
jgi:hypothetical protein